MNKKSETAKDKKATIGFASLNLLIILEKAVSVEKWHLPMGVGWCSGDIVNADKQAETKTAIPLQNQAF